jgi:hypothetical protein
VLPVIISDQENVQALAGKIGPEVISHMDQELNLGKT